MNRPIFVVLALSLALAVAACDTGDLKDPPSGLVSGPPGELVDIPAGSFTMGGYFEPVADWNQDRPDDGFSDERPARTVELPTYRIQAREVTNDQYRACVDAVVCREPSPDSSLNREHYFLDPFFGGYPVVNVRWEDAAAYCAWAGLRLPTEAEWEKAARGADGPRDYPWGDEQPDCARANLGLVGTDEEGNRTVGCAGDTAPVGSYPDGASPYGVLDLSGNVAEWTADWYAADAYDTALYPENLVDPQGPPTGTARVLRGGSFASAAYLARTGFRDFARPGHAASDLGFRCAGD